MLVTESRPRNLRWFHAGPLLYGDWGTSRLYVLGLAFFYTAHASVVYLAAIGALMLAVGWAYTVVCRSFPDGGGVYTAARRISPLLSVVGATLLLTDYIMTAAISVVEAYHYFGLHDDRVLVPLSVATLVLVGGVNWLGARSAGRFALVIAFVAIGISALMALACVPFFWRGVQTINFDYFRSVSPWQAWVSFTGICLALAGVEAVANMTGLMTKPVDRTAKKTLWPVTIEVVSLNMVFGLALAGLSISIAGVPLSETHEAHARVIERGEMTADDQQAVERYTNASMKVIAEQAGDWWAVNVFGATPRAVAAEGGADAEATSPAAVGEGAIAAGTLANGPDQSPAHGPAHGPSTGHLAQTTLGFVFGKVAGITFGLLLLSACNTAVMAMVSVLFALGQDDELPKRLTRLNYSGVPWVSLIVAVVMPCGVVLATTDVTMMAKLYGLGVSGAIAVTLTSTAFNKKLPVGKWSRAGLIAVGGVLLAVSLTIAGTQLISTAFCGGLIATALVTRWVMRANKRSKPEPFAEPTLGWLAEVEAAEDARIDPDKPRVMLAARGRHQAEFAVDLARKRGATLFVMFVRQLRVLDVRPGSMPGIEDDKDAQEALGSAVILAKANGVKVLPIYVTATEIAPEILDHTVTYGCRTLIMGQSRRSLFARRLQGDVLRQVAEALPDDVELITRAGDTPHAHRLVLPETARVVAAAESADDDDDAPKPKATAPHGHD